MKGLWLHGASGRMGKEISRALAEAPASARKLTLKGGSAEDTTREALGRALTAGDVSVIVDFTSDAGNLFLLEAIESTPGVRGKALLIGTTGLPAPQLARWRSLSQERGFATLVAPNTSVGILLTVRAALQAAGVLAPLGYDVEIVETHHRHKKDAPSGTARFIGQALTDGIEGLRLVTDRKGARAPGEIGVHAVRGGGVFGEHEVRIIGEADEIAITHRAFSRALFASGALVLADWIARQKPGVYGLLDIDLKALLP